MKLLRMVVVIAFSATAALGEQAFDDAKALFDKGDYKACLSHIAKAIPTQKAKYVKPKKGEKPKADPIYDWYMLRAEAQLQLRVREEAIEAFKSADEWAVTPAERAEALGVMWLLQESPKLVYTPPGKDALDVVNADSRKAALAALFERRIEAIAPEITRGTNARTVAALYPLLGKLTDLYLLELSTGADSSRTAAAAEPVGETCRILAAREITPIDSRTAQLKAKASQKLIIEDAAGRDFNTHAGLTNIEKAELRKNIEYLRGVREYVRAGRALNSDKGATGPWRSAEEELDAAINRAKDVVNRNWTAWK